LRWNCERGDLAAERQADHQPEVDARALSTGSAPRQPQADRAGVDVRRIAERQLAAAEHLRPRLQLDVDLEPDDGSYSTRSPARLRLRRAADPSKPIACSSAYAASSRRFSLNAGAGELEADRQARR
jgi:hypothetical protein